MLNPFWQDIDKLQHFPVGVRYFSNSRPERIKLFIRNWLQLDQYDFETKGHQVRPRRPQKPLKHCFRNNSIEIQGFLKDCIPVGSKSTNKISPTWSPKSGSLSSKTYDGLSLDILRNTAVPLVGSRGGRGRGAKDL